MPNGSEMVTDMEFEKKLDGMKRDGTLPEFTARTLYQLTKKFEDCTTNLPTKKQTLGTSGIVALIVSIAVGVIEYFTKRG